MDGVFFLKAMPSKLPSGMKGIALDPPALGISCSGVDPRCSTAYSQMWQHFGGSSGVVKNLRKLYGIDGRVAFVGFSAAHGFLNPLLNNDQDRADTSAVILMDATFGGGKDGYVKAAKDAMVNKLLLVTTTSNTGGDASWKQFVWDLAKPLAVATTAVPPMPVPSGGVKKAGQLWYYRYVDAKGGTELPHWEMGKILPNVVQAHLIPYWSGGVPSARKSLIPALLTLGGLYLSWRWLSQHKSKG